MSRNAAPVMVGAPLKKKLLGVEAARGIAALMVVFYHAARHMKLDIGYLPLGATSKFGHAGVDFFFVLSGFIIYYVHRGDFGAPARLSHYFERRFTRIYPMFWFSVALALLLTLASGKHTLPNPFFLLQWLSLLPNTADLGVAWTLQHEILFYFAFAVAIVHRRAGLVVFGMWLTFILTCWLTKAEFNDSALLMRLGSAFNIEFFFGMLSAHVVRCQNVPRPMLVLGTGMLLFLTCGVLEDFELLDGYASQARVAYGLCSMLVVIGLAASESSGRVVIPSFLARFGGASYSVYLLHLPCIGISYKLLELSGLLHKLPVSITYFLVVGAGVSGGVVVSRLIEYRLMGITRQALVLLRRDRTLAA